MDFQIVGIAGIIGNAQRLQPLVHAPAQAGPLVACKVEAPAALQVIQQALKFRVSDIGFRRISRTIGKFFRHFQFFSIFRRGSRHQWSASLPAVPDEVRRAFISASSFGSAMIWPSVSAP